MNAPTCASTRYGPGCGHPTADHDLNQDRDCCCCTGRHNNPDHVQGCLDCATLHAKRWAGPGATNGDVAPYIPEPLRPAFWRRAIERCAAQEHPMSGYIDGPTLAPTERPWPLRWESDPAIDLCGHQWERVHLLADSKYRLVEDDVIRCAICHTPRCGEVTDDDPCIERRHHHGVHIYLSGRFEPLSGYLRPEAGGSS